MQVYFSLSFGWYSISNFLNDFIASRIISRTSLLILNLGYWRIAKPSASSNASTSVSIVAVSFLLTTLSFLIISSKQADFSQNPSESNLF
jgi:hypothetical protein